MSKQQENIINNKTNEHVTALQQAFTAHVKYNESKIKDMEKKMENKSIISNTNTNEFNSINLQTRVDNMEQMCRNMSAMQNANVTDVKSMELAEFGRFLKTGSIETKSMGTTDSDGGVLLSKPISKELWTHMKRYPLIDGAKQLHAKGKTIHVIKDTANIEDYAHWGKEGYDQSKEMTPDFKTLEMKINTCSAFTTVTRDFLDDMSGNVVQEWIGHAITKSFADKMSYGILYGTADKTMEGILSYNDSAKQSGNKEIETVKIADGKELEGLLSMFSRLDVEYFENAGWYVSKGFFNKLSEQLLSNNSTQFAEMFKMRLENNISPYTFLGKPMYIIPHMRDDQPVILADLNVGYYIVHHENGTVKRTEVFDLDVIRYGYRLRVGGQVIASEAFIIGESEQK